MCNFKYDYKKKPNPTPFYKYIELVILFAINSSFNKLFLT